MNDSYHHGDLRRAVLDRVVEVIIDEGTDGVSLRALAADLAVSHTAPRHHFGSRQGIFTALATEGHRLLAADLAAGGEAGGLLDVGVAYVRFAMARPAHFEVMFAPRLLDLTDPELTAARAETFALLAGGVAALEADGRVSDPSAAVLAAWAVVHGIATLALTGNLDASTLLDQLPDNDLLDLTRRSAGLLFPPRGAS